MKLELKELKSAIRGLGLFRNKEVQDYLQDIADLVGEVQWGRCLGEPGSELMQLPGVGRKTANVVLANAFQDSSFSRGIPMCIGCSNRLGIVAAKKVEETEAQVMDLIPKADGILCTTC